MLFKVKKHNPLPVDVLKNTRPKTRLVAMPDIKKTVRVAIRFAIIRIIASRVSIDEVGISLGPTSATQS